MGVYAQDEREWQPDQGLSPEVSVGSDGVPEIKAARQLEAAFDRIIYSAADAQALGLIDAGDSWPPVMTNGQPLQIDRHAFFNIIVPVGEPDPATYVAFAQQSRVNALRHVLMPMILAVRFDEALKGIISDSGVRHYVASQMGGIFSYAYELKDAWRWGVTGARWDETTLVDNMFRDSRIDWRNDEIGVKLVFTGLQQLDSLQSMLSDVVIRIISPGSIQDGLVPWVDADYSVLSNPLPAYSDGLLNDFHTAGVLGKTIELVVSTQNLLVSTANSPGLPGDVVATLALAADALDPSGTVGVMQLSAPVLAQDTRSAGQMADSLIEAGVGTFSIVTSSGNSIIVDGQITHIFGYEDFAALDEDADVLQGGQFAKYVQGVVKVQGDQSSSPTVYLNGGIPNVDELLEDWAAGEMFPNDPSLRVFDVDANGAFLITAELD
jgi:hypothetical protein